MSEPAVLASRSGSLTDGLSALVAARGYGPVETSVTDRPEHGRYYLSPATVDRVEQRAATDAGSLTLVVDGTPHPGQLADLRTRLPSAAVVDKRGVVWGHLAEANRVAATRRELQAARITRRQVADTQRGAATAGPSGTSGRLADSDERIRTLRDTLTTRQEAARERVQTSHRAADARVVLVGSVGAPTTPLWTALTDEHATAAPGRPARATTALATVGPHTVAVTDTPGVPGSGDLPEWLLAAVPGVSAALTQATAVLGVGENCDGLTAAVADRFDVPCRSLAVADAATARAALEEIIESVTFAVRLPYSDAAHALVSDLHDRAVVHAIEYDDAITLRLEVARGSADDVRRRVTAADGEVKPLGTSR